MRTSGLVVLCLCLACATALASVDVEVSTGMLLETTGGGYVEIDGALSEVGTGYLKGRIASGSRTGMTSFAELTLSAGMDGTVIRTTGAAYAKGHGEGTNFKRSYEVNNTGGGAVTADVQIAYVGSGTYDERNGLTGPYFLYRYASGWTGYGDGVFSSPDSAAGVVIPVGATDWVLSEGVRVAAKIFLEGPYDADGDSMTTTLGPDSDDVIPATSPYSEDVRTATAVPSGVTDWVLVQVRSTVDGSALGARSCFLKANGMLVGDDGSTGYIGVKVPPGGYYVVVRHRNHLAVMTAAAVAGLTWGVTPSTYDFTTGSGQFYGTGGAKELETDVWGMIAGDPNSSGGVNATDYLVVKGESGQSGYYAEDCNMSGLVNATDYLVIKPNSGKNCQVP